jgi:hypothetical protein
MEYIVIVSWRLFFMQSHDKSDVIKISSLQKYQHRHYELMEVMHQWYPYGKRLIQDPGG